MEQIQRNFLWAGQGDEFKYHLVDWTTVCKSVNEGGLGIRRLHEFNVALLGKWLWRFSNERNRLWRKVITTKFGEEWGGWVSKPCSRPCGVSLWKGIRAIWPTFQQSLAWKVGCGSNVLFWKHRWKEEGRLADLFPDLYAIAVDKCAAVADYYQQNGQFSTWHILLRRQLNDWEMNSFLHLMGLLHEELLRDSVDTVKWLQTKKEIFTVKSFFKAVVGRENVRFPWKKIWKAGAPTRVAFLVWCAAKNRILTMDNLQRRGIYVTNRCPLCKTHAETVSHLFIHCVWTSELWNLVMGSLGLHWCVPADLQHLLDAWWGLFVCSERKAAWMLAPFCLIWLVWKERNRRVFENIEEPSFKMKSRFMSCLYSWVHGGFDPDVFSFSNFVEFLST